VKRRDLLQLSATLGLAAALPRSALSESKADSGTSQASAAPNPLRPPADGLIPVAFLLSEGAVVIDFAGPWEVFENVHVPGAVRHPFQLYTVAETTAPIHAGGGMTIVPNYSLASAPPPKVIVIPAQSDPSDAVIAWVRNSTRTTDVTMSVCTGAFLLAKTGLLSGKAVATHHGAYAELAMAFPDIWVKRGARFVESGNLASSGGLSSGIDLALHVVERYFGHAVALSTADNLEYQGLGWMNPDSNQAYATRRVSTDKHPLCPVCEMDVDVATAPKSIFRGRTYYFCMDAHKRLFDAGADRFVSA
jgi:transcriptional regulator GlxA family with amidase domain/YHS domain-containing protein